MRSPTQPGRHTWDVTTRQLRGDDRQKRLLIRQNARHVLSGGKQRLCDGRVTPADKRAGRRLADMGMPVEDEKYIPPSEEICDPVIAQDVDLGDGLVLWIASRYYKGRIVHYSLSLKLKDEHGEHEISRIDTSHGEVHQHRYHRNGSKDRRVFNVIPRDDGWKFVDDSWQGSFDRMIDEADDLVERWSS